jgi:hypothetical protein
VPVVGEEAGCESTWLAKEGEYKAPLNLYGFSKGIKLHVPEPWGTMYSRPVSGVLTVNIRPGGRLARKREVK